MRETFLLGYGCLFLVFLVGCTGTRECVFDSPENTTLKSKVVKKATGKIEIDAVSGASIPYYDKSEYWNKENLLKALRNHKSWTPDVFFAIATVDDKGKPNIASIVPYAIRDDVFVFANKQSATRHNIETQGECFAIFRTNDSNTADPKKYDYFGVVGNKIKLKLIDDAGEKEKLWKEYKNAGTPISPPHFDTKDHFFMKVVKILPIG